jgi:hypothetical protein
MSLVSAAICTAVRAMPGRARAVAALLAGVALAGQQVDVVVCEQGDVVAGGAVALAAAFAFALRAAVAEVDGDVGGLVFVEVACGIGHALVGVVALEGRSRAGQCLHAPIAGVAGRVRHLLAGFHGTEKGTADADGEGRLFELIFGLVAAGFAGFHNIYPLGEDGDVACGSDHVAADLFVGNACLQGDVAGDAAHGAGSSGGAFRFLFGGSLLRANTDAATVIEHAALFSFLERGRAAGQVQMSEGDKARVRYYHNLRRKHSPFCPTNYFPNKLDQRIFFA